MNRESGFKIFIDKDENEGHFCFNYDLNKFT